jgi:hypothetical protein
MACDTHLILGWEGLNFGFDVPVKRKISGSCRDPNDASKLSDGRVVTLSTAVLVLVKGVFLYRQVLPALDGEKKIGMLMLCRK